MDRTRIRGWLVLGALFAAAGVSSCGRDAPVAIQRSMIADPSKYVVWDPEPPLCLIGKQVAPGGSGTWHGTGVPTVDTTCGVIVTMSFPTTSTPALWFRNFFYWVHVEPAGGGKSTGYQLGEFNDGENGPIKYTFSQPVTAFSLQVQDHVQSGIEDIDIGPGHYMLAFNTTSGGTPVDSVNFGPGAGVPRVDVKTLTGLGIRRVDVHFPRLGPDGNGDFSIPQLDRLVRQASFSQDTCPPKDSILDVKLFRDSLKMLLDESNPNEPNVVNRVERAGALLQHKTTGAYKFTRSNPDPNADNCQTVNDFSFDASQYKLLATTHSHPYTLLEPIPFCGTTPNGKPYVPGGSVKDWTSLKAADSAVRSSQTERVREYVIDKNGVTRLDLTNPNNQKVFLHSKPGCAWYP